MADFLSDNEKKRYLRQIMITSWDETVQMKLKKAHVFVAGAGGLGSPSIYYLAAAGVGRITICDNDRVELSNLNRQILHRTGGIGISRSNPPEMLSALTIRSASTWFPKALKHLK